MSDKPANLFPFTHYGNNEGLFAFHEYTQNGRVAVELLGWENEYEYMERYAVLSVNDDEVAIEDGEFIAKEYSENEGLVQQFIDAGFFEDTGKRCALGHVDDVRILRILPKARQHAV